MSRKAHTVTQLLALVASTKDTKEWEAVLVDFS
jgi:hypothetical protein